MKPLLTILFISSTVVLAMYGHPILAATVVCVYVITMGLLGLAKK